MADNGATHEEEQVEPREEDGNDEVQLVQRK